MPFGINGIKLVEFIRSIQKKFNLVIYEDKTTPNQMVVESFNDWYLKGQVQDFNQYINIDNKLEFIPANTLAVNKVDFTDKLDADFVSKDFQQINNRTYGQAFFLDTGSYFSQGEFKVETACGSGPIFQLPLTVFSGSAVVNQDCTTYAAFNYDINNDQDVNYIDCDGAPVNQTVGSQQEAIFCASTIPSSPSLDVVITALGSCGPGPSPAQATSSFLPVAIPLYIGDQNFKPTQVFPRVMFYNNTVSSSQYFIEAQFSPANRTVSTNNKKVYPYFDNYNVVTGSFPSSGSRSLLFNNETATLGSTPTESLISEYWSTYINLLYDPRTRLVNATAVIPLAKYFDMELNDLVQFRGNYYHLRAINDYDLTTGECLVQLLGPIISDSLAAQQFGTLPASGSGPTIFGDFNCDYNNDFFNDNATCSPPAPAARTTASIDFLIVGGGGGGGTQGGGAGAGAYRSGSLTLNTGSYTIQVGHAGTGAIYLAGAAQTGSDSSMQFMTSSVTAQGGGVGGSAGNSGGNGGSGGGGSFSAAGGIGVTGGNDGGAGAGGGTAPNGGGGGASAVGVSAVSNGNSGAGGAGLAWLDSVTYAGGGGGGYTSQGAVFGAGGSGGGGRGSISSVVTAQAGTNGRGGGGGGGGNNAPSVGIDGAKGGDGVVIVRYAATASFMTGGTITNSGGFVFHTFTNTTGSGTLSFT